MGLSIAHRLAGGRRLLFADYSDANLKSASTALRNEGHLVEAHAMNIIDYEAVAKRGNQLLVQSAARAWGAKGARVNSISPGVISTGLVQKDMEGPGGDSMRSMIETSAARRIGTPDDITNIVAFLVNSEWDFITGNDILVVGGTVSARRWT